ncbi:uncharacterized protein LOC100370291 [Saccoglossus kowalevskii]|uniref:non-specific serine/threonine protein kinase n=1 Tax=Saccoglossus kowalevskii TaxID=10224 RepID=A0ABM0H1Z2_SACKO|nr:PREDICTED: serine/threonine-protein kinase Nek11-like [Saccoglossus kowalevskii]
MPPSRGIKKPKEDKSDHRVLANRYRVEKKLGSGNFGTAFLVFDLKTKKGDEELKVLKEIAVGELAPDETVDAVHEAKLLSRLNHPGIVRFSDSFLDMEFFCLITEYCEGGDLDVRITKAKKEGKSFEQNQIMDWFVQLALAVDYMHSRRVLHRDLKTRNIFLKNNMCKIGDFGISRVLMGTTDLASTFTGTPYYMSPEVLKHEGYNSKSDVWSIACILYELCALEHAFEGQSLMGVMYKIVEGKIPKIPNKYDKNIQEILTKVLIKEPGNRPSAAEVLNLPFVARHMEKMATRMAGVREHQRDVEVDIDQQQQIFALAREKTHLQDLREESLNKLTPKEQLIMRKLQDADEKAKELTMHTRANLAENIHRKALIQGTISSYNRPAWQGGRGEAAGTMAGGTVIYHDESPGGTLVYHGEPEGTYYEPEDYSGTMLYEREDIGTVYQTRVDMGQVVYHDDDDDVVMRTTEGSSSPSDFSTTYIVRPDDRPINPMKNPNQIYSSQNGQEKDNRLTQSAPVPFTLHDDRPIKAAASLGSTSYDNRPITPMTKPINWDDPDITNAVPPGLSGYKKTGTRQPRKQTKKAAPSKKQGTTPPKKQVTKKVPPKKVDPQPLVVEAPKPEEAVLPEKILNAIPEDANAAETFYSEHEDFESDGDDDVDALIGIMQQALHNPHEVQDTIADSSMGMFSPTVRASKITNLRAECERKLGKKEFKLAYSYLKQARFGEGMGEQSVDEGELMKGLKKFVKNPSDCFLIDQLLFLEYQANI